jgi:esterase/lipase
MDFAKRHKLGFLALEYSGHGKSSGKFIDGNISKWSNEVNFLIKRIVKKNKIILIGSSMGAWISLNQFKFFKKQIVGFLGIGSAPEFLENLIWNKFSKKMKNEIKVNGIINLKHGDNEYPITSQLIKDAKKNKVLNKKIYQNLNVTMVHGSKDKSVPVIYSRKVLKIFTNAKKKLVIIKDGDHSLSSSRWLNVLKNELKLIIN